jgi:cytochrome c-type biogenesis protein
MLVVAAILLANFIVIGIFLLNRPNPSSLASDFTLTDAYGKTFSLSDYSGRVVVLSFMGTRCSSCRVEVRQLKQVYDKYHDSVAILSISIDTAYDTNEQLLQFINETGITWPVAKSTDNVKNDYDVKTVPTIFLIDKSGYVRFKHAGEITEESLSKEIVKLL